jgi:hypothetical protein
MFDKQKYKRVVNGIEDWVAYGFVDPSMTVPDDILAEHFPYLTAPVLVTDICWHREFNGNTLIRLGWMNGKKGTLVSEEWFDIWLSCVPDGATLYTFDEYAQLITNNAQ